MLEGFFVSFSRQWARFEGFLKKYLFQWLAYFKIHFWKNHCSVQKNQLKVVDLVSKNNNFTTLKVFKITRNSTILIVCCKVLVNV